LLAVINLYKDPQRLATRLPLLADLTRSIEDIETLAAKVLPAVLKALSGKAVVELQSCKSQIGSGALPLDLMESRALVITPVAEKGATDKALQQLSRAFRGLPKPVIGRVYDGQLLFDLRCLRDVEEFIRQLELLRL